MSNNQLRQQILDALNFRYACKLFDKNRIIPEEDFNLILEAARLSPSAFGFQPWSFVVLQNKEIREGIIPNCWGARRQAPTASHFVLVLARRPIATMYNSEYLKDVVKNVLKLPEDLQKGRLERYENFVKNEFKMLGDDKYLFDYACKQCYIAMANMMTVAALMNIDSCAMEGFDIEKTEDYLVEKGVFDPEQFGLASMVAFGYRDPEDEIFEKARHEMSEIVSWVE